MSENFPQPRWGLLYLTLPLAGLLFGLIQRVRPSGAVRSLLDVGVLLIVGVLVEAWRLANTLALLHHPFAGHDGEPIYYAREVAGSRPVGSGGRVQATFVADSFSDIFPFVG